MRIHNPCKECNNRQIGCHSGCADYKAFIEANEAHKQLIKDKRIALYGADAYEHKKAARLSKLYPK